MIQTYLLFYRNNVCKDTGERKTNVPCTLFWRCDLFSIYRNSLFYIHSNIAFKPHLKLRVFQQWSDMNNTFVRCGLFFPFPPKNCIGSRSSWWRRGERFISNAFVLEEAKFKERILHLPQRYQVLQWPSVPFFVQSLRINSHTRRPKYLYSYMT